MANEYNGQSYGIIYPQSSNAIDNLLQIKQQQQQNKLLLARENSRLQEEDQKHIDAYARYAESLVAGAGKKIDPKNPFKSILDGQLSVALKNMNKVILTGGANEAMLLDMAHDEIGNVTAMNDNYNAKMAQIANSAKIGKGMGMDETEGRQIGERAAFFKDDPNNPGNPILDIDKLKSDDTTDFVRDAIVNHPELFQNRPDPFAKFKYRTVAQGAVDAYGSDRSLLSTKHSVRVIDELNGVKEVNGIPVAEVIGAVPVTDGNKPLTEEVPDIDPTTNKVKLDGKGQPINKSVPVMALTPERYSHLNDATKGALNIATTANLNLYNKKLDAAGLPIYEGDKADIWKRTEAYKMIPKADIQLSGQQNLTARSNLIEERSRRLQLSGAEIRQAYPSASSLGDDKLMMVRYRKSVENAGRELLDAENEITRIKNRRVPAPNDVQRIEELQNKLNSGLGPLIKNNMDGKNGVPEVAPPAIPATPVNKSAGAKAAEVIKNMFKPKPKATGPVNKPSKGKLY